MITTATKCRPLRADAVRNREKILAAAAIVFAKRGLDATLDEVAAQAGVGVGTVYRRFPDKDTLIYALFQNAVDEIATLALSAYEVENSWEGLVWFLREALERQCANRGLRDIVVGTPYARERMESVKCRIAPAIELLIERAQRDGYLRDDVVGADFAILEMMISSLSCMTDQIAADLWRRYLTIILDGLVVKRDGPTKLDQPLDERAADLTFKMKSEGISRLR
ncbi:MAG: helix-turn-helix domain-containing protein [Acidimicrobiales bacterium]